MRTAPPPGPAPARRALAAVYVAGSGSAFGSQMTMLALPWLVLESTDSAPRAGLVFAVSVLPMALLGFVGGEVIQRFGARRTMVVADVAQAVAIAVIPVLAALDRLSFPLLLAVVAVIGVLGVPYFAAQRDLATELVGPDPKALMRANSVLEGCSNVAALAGPAVAGVLIATLGAEQVLWFDAATYALSGLLLWWFVPRTPRVAAPPPRPEQRTVTHTGVLAGVRAVLGDDFLRRVMVSTVSFGFLMRVLMLALPLLAFDRFGGDAKVGGLLLSGFGAGAIAGAAVSYLIGSRLSPMLVFGLAAFQLVLPWWVLLFDVPVPVLVGALAVSGAALPLSNAPFFSILATRFAADIRAKVIQAVMTISNIAGPLGFVAGGMAIGRFGVTATLLVLAVLSTLAAVNLVVALRRFGPATLTSAQPAATAAR
ncbi:MFS transporter [Micromonospora sp. HUAS LYJ1]|uniref:MFS transporter n=1 Tax=Micromonospora sp. HUAS LYJ1 TaxID=3061626 RepID=UPI002673166F|nr:MFS transporter [Micromonospora sp. HUAS LYJ1]WKU02972.1 MFS transporter [Micromonospora sp. HUAS LYJ1]